MQLLQIKIRFWIYLKRTKSSEVPFWAFGSDYDNERITHLIVRSNTGLTHLKVLQISLKFHLTRIIFQFKNADFEIFCLIPLMTRVGYFMRTY